MNKKNEAKFLELLGTFPGQISKAIQNVAGSKLLIPTIVPKIKNIVFVGMGGSGIAGDLFYSIFNNQLKIPFIINKKEYLPEFVDESTLIIAVSYSGSTSEILNCVNEAVKRKAFVCGVTSGGELAKIVEKSGGDLIRIEPGFPPRLALGSLFFSVAAYMEQAKFIKIDQGDLTETLEVLKSIKDRAHPSKQGKNCLSFKIARSLYKKFPFIYTANTEYEAVVLRWKNQFEENAKTLAHANVIPEMNHNEIMGWEGDASFYKSLSVVVLECENLSPERKIRLDVTKHLIQKKCDSLIDVFPEGDSLLARVFSLIYMGDWISFFLAQFYKQDPIAIKSITRLKNELKERR